MSIVPTHQQLPGIETIGSVMNKISSKSTFFYKRTFPSIWFCLQAIFLLLVLVSAATNKIPSSVAAFIILILILVGIIGFISFRFFVWDLADEVLGTEDSLIIKTKGIEKRIRLEDIMNINYNGFANPPRITLMFREPKTPSTTISFTPPYRFFHFSTHPIATDLIERVDAIQNRN